jgi:hypothetical protein
VDVSSFQNESLAIQNQTQKEETFPDDNDLQVILPDNLKKVAEDPFHLPESTAFIRNHMPGGKLDEQ